jgi:type 2 lantibiotic biosynthesis protein LanM
LDEKTFFKLANSSEIPTNTDNLSELKNLLECILNKADKNYYVENNLVEYDRIDLFYSLGPIIEVIKEKIFTFSTYEHINKIQKYIHFGFVEEFMNQINNYLKMDLFGSTLVEELNCAREAGLLIGHTSEKRFQYYSLFLTSSKDWLEYYLSCYPVLLYKLNEFIKNIFAFILEFLGHLVSDYGEIAALLGLEPEMCYITGINLFIGDLHNNNKSVTGLEFNNHFRIVYKPRNLSIENNFYSFIKWIRNINLEIDFKSPSAVLKQDHSWIEWITNTPCNSIADVKQYYSTMGKYLAIFYFFGSKDIITDNIIAFGRTPVFIDLECFITNKITEDMSGTIGDTSINRIYQDSVIRTGLLPIWASGDTEEGKRMIGGIISKNKMPNYRFIWENKGTDMMEYKVMEGVMTIEKDSHLPVFNEIHYPIDNFVDMFISGFEYVCRFFMQHKNDLLQENSILNIFNDNIVRVIARETQIYSIYRRESKHPDYLCDSINTDYLFDNLWTNFNSPLLTSGSIQSEIEQLWNMDVPMFYSSTNSRSFWDGYGKLVALNYFQQTALNEVRERITFFSEELLKIQTDFIRSSIQVYFDSFEINQIEDSFFMHFRAKDAILKTGIDLNKQKLLDIAENIGNNILDRAYQIDNEIGWFGKINIDLSGAWGFSPLHGEIYGGKCGIALFFHNLYKITNNSKYYGACQNVLENELINLDYKRHSDFYSAARLRGNQVYISPLSYPFGILYLIDLLNTNNNLNTESKNYFFKIIDDNLDELPDDLLWGSAGAILLFLNLFESTQEERYLEYAEKLGVSILKHAIHIAKDKVAWDSFYKYDKNKPTCLGGFSHGTSGIALALFRLAHLNNNEIFHEFAIKALNYDRSLFDPVLKGWIELRNSKKKEDSTSWCHGASGIGLSRLLISNYYKDDVIKVELEIALQKMIENGFSGNQCICHGSMGNIEIFNSIAKNLKIIDQVKFVNKFWEHFIEIYDEKKLFKLEKSSSVLQNMSLFTGLSGIGYQIIRFINWESTPSIIAIEGSNSFYGDLH